MNNPERFVDTGKFLSAFADEILVACTGCGAPGVVHATWAPYRWDANFECGQCHLTLSSKLGHWVGAVCSSGRQPCGLCGHQWVSASIEYSAPPAEPPTQLKAECARCGGQTLISVSTTRQLREARCCDPHFGLPLRLATSTRHGTVWAYNLRHVQELSGYVSARLRVRQDSSNSAMFSRLPRWMKLAKHREEIAKALSKLDAMARSRSQRKFE